MNGIVIQPSSSRQAKSIVYLIHDHLQWHQIADLAWAYCLGQIVRQPSPGPTTEFYLTSHASYPLPCGCMR
jgi:hypothetical protein